MASKNIILDEFVLAMDYIVSLCSGCFFDRNKQIFSIITKTVEVSFDKLCSKINNKYSFYEIVFTAKWLKYQNLCWDCIFCVNLHSFQQFVYLIRKMKKITKFLKVIFVLLTGAFFYFPRAHSNQCMHSSTYSKWIWIYPNEIS